MDWMTFITKIIDSIAWPAAIVLVIWWLKSHIGQLIPFTKKFKYGDLEIEFEQQLKELKKEAEASKLEHATPERDSSEMLSYLSETADVSPRAAIVDAWVGLELTAFNSAGQLGIENNKRPMPFSRLIAALESEGIIKPKDSNILKKLMRLRNEALHSPNFNITKKEAQEFAELARDMADLIAGECFQKTGGCGH
ncbi:MAG: hypothetical protein PHQ90_08450 [Sulfuricurvum sp.]|uniref:DUF4145 domain-containing protein n=1 Tax=Sulfuricurvum sp. TaxID=2025608 RepID=UPI0026163741|nr:hypothetical protein [Sulfuricurvum sp.]MDD2369317.1 hypothetical protein [Sulfuricurvum sp.]MDD2950000.1 hypothetical protein [Sulfuricurvum sp.]MDD5118711.1 hypothetical protein [Sulfuricurvum sp.]